MYPALMPLSKTPLHLALSLTLGFVTTFSMPLFAADSELEEKFAKGLSAREAGEYDSAIAEFQAILSADPDLGRARAELALSYFKALNFAEAKAEAEKVLADPNTPDGVQVNVQKFLDTINAESKPHVFTPYITFGFGHDDNINVGPSSRVINIGGAQLVANATELSKNYNMQNIGLSHRYLSPNTFSLFNQTAAYLWQSNVGFYRNDYFSSSDFDLNVLSLSTGPLFVVAEHWRAGVDFSYDYIDLGHQKLAEFYGVSPKVTWSVNRSTSITLDGQVQKRAFNDNAAPGRDSDYQNIGFSFAKSLLDTKLNLQLGAKLFNENADVNRFSNDGYQLSAGASYSVTGADSIYAKHAFKNSEFDGKEVLFNEARDEDENRTTIGYSHQFTQSFVKDWTLDASITHTKNGSNISVFDYKRTQYGVTMGKFF